MFNRCLISVVTNNSEIMSYRETLKIRDGNVTDISSLELYSRGLSSLNNSVKFLIVAGMLFGVGIGLLLKDYLK